MSKKTTFLLSEQESRDAYKLLSGLIVPRPIGWIGTTREDGTFNLAPFSFFNVVASNPPTVLFSGGTHPDRPKDSVALAESSGEFTVNIVSEDVAAAMSVTAGRFRSEDDEFAIAGLTPFLGVRVAAPMVVESPANMECVVTEVVDIGPDARTRVVFGEVVALHVRDRVLDGTRIVPDELKAIGRMAGDSYIRTSDRFELARP